MNADSKKSDLVISRRIPDPVPDPIETNLDPKVKIALSQMADKVRDRAKARARTLENDISILICDFVRDYNLAGSSCPRALKELDNLTWQHVLNRLCDGLGRHIGEIDVERCVQNLSAKILEIDSNR